MAGLETFGVSFGWVKTVGCKMVLPCTIRNFRIFIRHITEIKRFACINEDILSDSGENTSLKRGFDVNLKFNGNMTQIC